MNYFSNWRNKNYMTDGLVAINILIYALNYLTGDLLLNMGMKINYSIQMGQWYRLVTAMFLHLSPMHLILNMITLYYVGQQLENIFGHSRFLGVYFISGISGNLMSFAFSSAAGAGASSAIFGLFGMYLMLGEAFRQNPYIRNIARQFMFLILLNLVFGFVGGGVDIFAHIGGALGGFLAAYAVGVPKLGRLKKSEQYGGLAVLLIMLIFFLVLGLNKGII